MTLNIVGTAHIEDIEGGAHKGGAHTGGGAPRPEGVAGSDGGVRPAHMENKDIVEQRPTQNM